VNCALVQLSYWFIRTHQIIDLNYSSLCFAVLLCVTVTCYTLLCYFLSIFLCLYDSLLCFCAFVKFVIDFAQFPEILPFGKFFGTREI